MSKNDRFMDVLGHIFIVLGVIVGILMVFLYFIGDIKPPLATYLLWVVLAVLGNIALGAFFISIDRLAMIGEVIEESNIEQEKKLSSLNEEVRKMRNDLF